MISIKYNVSSTWLKNYLGLILSLQKRILAGWKKWDTKEHICVILLCENPKVDTATP